MEKNPGKTNLNAIKVWDIPTRIFHWLLVGLLLISFVTVTLGPNTMPYHEGCGIGILGVLVFRLIWGIIGGYHSRFTSFVRGPREVGQYASTFLTTKGSRYLGHNPLGGWSVLAMLGAALLQAVTGLFANDDIFTEGPLYPYVDKIVSDQLTTIHRLNSYLIMGLVAVHILAILFYLVVKRENLIRPMITGIKSWDGGGESSAEKPWAALAAAGTTALIIYVISCRL
ncbi:MAG: cytochrome b/b6 domain-containing protein [Thermodesulfobacteriota bacterium]